MSDIEKAREKAQAILSWLCNRLIHAGNDALQFVELRGQATVVLRTFFRELETLLKNGAQNEHILRSGLNLQIHWYLVKLTLDTLIFGSEDKIDAATDDFQALLQLCERFASKGSLNGTELSSRHQLPSIDLSVGNELVQTVLFLSSWCRDRKVRQQALAFLQRMNRREGIWFSDQAAAVVEWIISTENSAHFPTTNVSHEKRIYIDSIQFYHDQRHDGAPRSDPIWDFRTPSWIAVTYWSASDTSRRGTQLISLLKSKGQRGQPPQSIHESERTLRDDLILSHELKDPVTPSTIAILLKSYKSGQREQERGALSGKSMPTYGTPQMLG